jgi:hypothetical protein
MTTRGDREWNLEEPYSRDSASAMDLHAIFTLA